MFLDAAKEFTKEAKNKDQVLKELKVLRAQVAILEEEKKARKRAEEETDLLKTLIIAINEEEDLNSSLTVALRKVCETTGWVVGQAWVPNVEETYLIASSSWCIPDEKLEKFRVFNRDIKFNLEVGLPGKVWASKHPIWYKDISTESFIVRNFLPDEFGLRAALGVPILSKTGEVVAVIEFFMYEEREVDAHLVSLISAVAKQVGSIIERRKVDDEFKKIQERFTGIYNSSKDAIGYCSLDGNFLDVNNSYVTLTGYSKEDLLSKNYKNITPGKYSDYDCEIRKKVFSTGDPAEYEKEYIRKDGSLVPVLVTLFLVRDKNNDPVAYAGIVKDMTERKASMEALRALNETLEQRVNARTSELIGINSKLQAEIVEREKIEKALRESEEKYRKLIEAANDAILIADAESGVIVGANSQAGKLLEMDVSEIIGMHQTQLHPKEEAENYKQYFIKHVQLGGGITEELFVCNKQGEKIPVEISASIIEISGKKMIQGIFRDLRKWKKDHDRIV